MQFYTSCNVLVMQCTWSTPPKMNGKGPLEGPATSALFEITVLRTYYYAACVWLCIGAAAGLTYDSLGAQFSGD